MNETLIKKSPAIKSSEIRLGAKEWVQLPELNLTLRAKVDTGAKTSSLHAINLHTFEQDQQLWVEFDTWVAPDEELIHLRLPVITQRHVRSSNGVLQERLVIETWLVIGPLQQKVQLTLADRSRMKYSMLLGRSAMRHPVIVEPSRSYIQSAPIHSSSDHPSIASSQHTSVP